MLSRCFYFRRTWMRCAFRRHDEAFKRNQCLLTTFSLTAKQRQLVLLICTISINVQILTKSLALLLQREISRRSLKIWCQSCFRSGPFSKAQTEHDRMDSETMSRLDEIRCSTLKIRIEPLATPLNSASAIQLSIRTFNKMSRTSTIVFWWRSFRATRRNVSF